MFDGCNKLGKKGRSLYRKNAGEGTKGDRRLKTKKKKITREGREEGMFRCHIECAGRIGVVHFFVGKENLGKNQKK